MSENDPQLNESLEEEGSTGENSVEEYDYEDEDDEDEDYYVDGDEEPNATERPAKRSLSSADYRIIDAEELRRSADSMTREVSSVLDIPKASAAVLLRHFKWSKEKLYDKYYEDPLRTRKNAGIQYLSKRSFADNTAMLSCPICFDTVSGENVFGLGCGHMFCKVCWRSYLTMKVSEGLQCIFATCPGKNCKEVVDDVVFGNILESSLYKKYTSYVLRSFVDINRSIKWCPSPGCDKAVVSMGAPTVVKCSCSTMFCFRCGEEAHAPASCDILALWLDKCRNESETANWILANTKKCPQCQVRIEKNQGCNHMTCRHCKHEFCWICLGSWNEHSAQTGGYYKCNRYDPTDEGKDDSAAARAKAELERYLHFYQRYIEHSQAREFAVKQRDETEKKMIELQESSQGSWIDVQFLKQAADMLIDCRRTLKYTYVHAYYLPAGKEKDLFEYLQEDLEKNVEHLSELTEMPIEKIDRAELINYTRVTERFLRNLLTGVEDGLVSVSNLQSREAVNLSS